MTERILLIYGKTGTGKTTLAKEFTKTESRLIVIDSREEYNDFIVITDFESLVDYTKANNDFKVSCRFESDIDIEFTFKWLFKLNNVCLLAEEAEAYISPYAGQSEFLKLIKYGRHHNIKVLGVARRTGELNINFRAMCEKIISLKQTEPNDLKKLNELGFEGLENLNQFVWSSSTPVPLEDVHYKSIIL